MTVISRQALVADIGGTNARFAISDIDELTIQHFAAFRCNAFASLPDAIRAYLNSVPHRPRMACLAIAGPTSGERLGLTNLPWSFTRAELRDATGCEHLHVVNDFEALAMALPSLTAHDLARIAGSEPVVDTARVVLGPGRGMGVAALVRSGSSWMAIGGEGGHASFAPEDRREMDLVERMREAPGAHVSVERMVSGPGLARLYGVLSARGGSPVVPLSAQEVVSRALAGGDAVAEAALDHFVAWLGRFAGDMALVYGARGGVYLGSGIAPNILGALDTPAFRSAFASKGRLFTYLEAVPVHVIKAADAGLKGAAVALATKIPA